MRILISMLMAVSVILSNKTQAAEVTSNLGDGRNGVIYFQSSNPPTFPKQTIGP